MLRVLHIIDSLNVGGSQRVLSRLIEGGQARGIEYHVCSLRGRDSFSEIMEKVVPVTHLSRSKYDPRTFWDILRLIKQFKPDVIQTMLLESCALGILLALFTHHKVILAPRGAMDISTQQPSFGSLWLTRLYVYGFPRLARWACSVVIQNNDHADSYLRHGVSAEQLFVIPNGIDPTPLLLSQDERKRKCDQFRAELGIPSEALVITQLGRLSPEKDPLMLLEAFALLAAQFPQVRLCFVGDGSEKDRLEARCSALQLTEHVHLSDFRPDIETVLAGTDILALPSSSEAFPNVVLEAWAGRLPVVATRCPGPLEMISADEDGILVPIGDALEMSQALQRLIRDPNLRRDFGEKGYQKLLAHYTVERMQTNYETLYRTLR